MSTLKEWFSSFDCQVIAMENTGVYWKPIWHILQADFKLILANSKKIKAIPSHKTDKKDAKWIAKLMRIDLIPTSFVPEETIQDWRDLTRSRKSLVESYNKEKTKLIRFYKHLV